MKDIYVLSRPVKKGKTTSVMDWAADKENIDGITAPVYLNQKHLYHLKTGVMKNLENISDCNSDKILTIGPYKFCDEIFEWGRDKLEKALEDQDLEWLVIDEIGPLEMEGQGLEPIISKILLNKEKYNFHLLLIIRDYLLKEVFTKYNIEPDSVKEFTHLLL